MASFADRVIAARREQTGSALTIDPARRRSVARLLARSFGLGVEPSASSTSARPFRAADGVERSAARQAGRAKVTARAEAPPSPGDGVDLAADSSNRRAS